MKKTNWKKRCSSRLSKLPTSLEVGRDIPLSLPGGLYLEHTIKIKTPGRQFLAPESIKRSESGILFSLNYRSKDETLYIEFKLKVDDKSVGLADARAVIELADEIIEQGAQAVYPQVATVSLSKRLNLNFTIPDKIEKRLIEVTALVQGKKYVEALEILNTLEEQYKKKNVLRGFIQTYRGALSSDLNRDKAALPMFKEAFSLYDPDTPSVYFSYATLLRQDDQNVEAMKIVRRLLKFHPESAKALRYEWIWSLMLAVYREEHFKDRENFVIALAAAQLQYVDDIKKTDRVFEGAFMDLGRRGAVEEAKAYLPYVTSPIKIRDILIDKELEALWPDLEVMAGDGLRTAINNYVIELKADVKSENVDFDSHSEYLRALMMSGQYEEAREYGDKVVKNWAKIEAVGQDAYWFVNYQAVVLDELGLHKQAQKLYEKILDTGADNEFSMASFVINFTDSLLSQEEFDKVLDQIEIIENDDAFEASDYGWMYLHQIKACAMSEQGNIKEAKKLYFESTKKIAEENIAVHFLALLCLGEDEKAEAVFIKRLKTKKHRANTLAVFSTGNERKNSKSFRGKLMGKVQKIAAQPNIQALFETYGRAIKIDGPAELWNEY